MRSLLKILPYLKAHRYWILLAILTAPLVAAIRSAPVALIKTLIDDVLKTKDPNKLILFPLMIIGVYAVNFVVRFIHYFANRIVAIRVNRQVKQSMFQHMMGLSADYFTTQRSGVLISRVGQDPNLIDQGIAQINVMIREPLQLVFLLGWCIYINWKLTLITMLIFPPLAFIFTYTNKAMKRYIARMQNEQGHFYSTLQEAFTGFRIIKSFQIEGYVEDKFKKQTNEFARQYLKTALVEELAHPGVEMVSAIAAAAILYVGGRQVLKGALTEGELLSFFTAFGVMMNPIRVLNDINIKLSTAAVAADRIEEVFSWKSKIVEIPNPISTHTFEREIQFQNVTFSYPDAPKRDILKDVSLTIRRGESVAFVGESGAGKSSLLALLPRIFEIHTGKVLIDGVDIRDLKISDLRQLISIVSQDVFLFNDTIYENIRCGHLNSSHEKIMEACRKANALDFIERLPDGFKTLIGDRGQKLSGGERQRISIARAFLRESPILLLDEATSALDNQSERVVQNAIELLMKNRTTLTIAHRLTTIQGVDRIYVMEGGKIVEIGHHEDLLRLNGVYSKFWNAPQVI